MSREGSALRGCADSAAQTLFQFPLAAAPAPLPAYSPSPFATQTDGTGMMLWTCTLAECKLSWLGLYCLFVFQRHSRASVAAYGASPICMPCRTDHNAEKSTRQLDTCIGELTHLY